MDVLNSYGVALRGRAEANVNQGRQVRAKDGVSRAVCISRDFSTHFAPVFFKNMPASGVERIQHIRSIDVLPRMGVGAWA
jgi:hypothetical protein